MLAAGLPTLVCGVPYRRSRPCPHCTAPQSAETATAQASLLQSALPGLEDVQTRMGALETDVGTKMQAQSSTVADMRQTVVGLSSRMDIQGTSVSGLITKLEGLEASVKQATSAVQGRL